MSALDFYNFQDMPAECLDGWHERDKISTVDRPVSYEGRAAPTTLFSSLNSENFNEQPWTSEQQMCLEQALREYPSKIGCSERWMLIAHKVPNKTPKECAQRFITLTAVHTFPSQGSSGKCMSPQAQPVIPNAIFEAPPWPENAPVQLIMTLGLDFSMAGSEGSDKREKFKRDVAEDLASASGLPPANFRIKDVSPGSIILDMEVMPDPLAPGAHLLAAKDLAEQAADPSSMLRSGNITSHATGVEVIPPKSAEPPPAKAEEELETGVDNTGVPEEEVPIMQVKQSKKVQRSAPIPRKVEPQKVKETFDSKQIMIFHLFENTLWIMTLIHV
jgi:hypothetical protein